MPGEAEIIVPHEPTEGELALAKEYESDFQALLTTRATLKKLEALSEATEAKILDAFNKLNIKSITVGDSRFTAVSRNTKVYGPEIEMIADELRLAKDTADKQGFYKEKQGKQYLKITV